MYFVWKWTFSKTSNLTVGRVSVCSFTFFLFILLSPTTYIPTTCFTRLTVMYSITCECIAWFRKSEHLKARQFFLSYNLYKTCVSSMIPSARLTDPPVAIIIFTRRLFCFAIFWKVGTDGDGQHLWKSLSLPASTVGRPSGSILNKSNLII